MCEHCDTPDARQIVRDALAEADVPATLAARVEAQRFGKIPDDSEDRFTTTERYGAPEITVGHATTLLAALQAAGEGVIEERLAAGAYADRFGVPVEAVVDQDQFLDTLESFVSAAEAIRAGDQRTTVEIPDDAASLVDGWD